jgi:hypothetical protein
MLRPQSATMNDKAAKAAAEMRAVTDDESALLAEASGVRVRKPEGKREFQAAGELLPTLDPAHAVPQGLRQHRLRRLAAPHAAPAKAESRAEAERLLDSFVQYLDRGADSKN